MVALLVLDEGDDTDVERWIANLEGVGLRAAPRLVAPGRGPGSLAGVAGVYVAGGFTPEYQEALCADPSWLPSDAVYAGFSAGAQIAPRTALVGGWRAGGIQVCDEGAGEDLDELELRGGLGLLEAVVDVHCAQWGTFGRLVHATRGEGWGIDEHTTLELDAGRAVAVHGTGRVWHAVRGAGGVAIGTHTAGRL